MRGLLISFIFAVPLAGKDIVPLQPFILGGENVEEGEFPFLISVWADGGFACAGTLIDKDVILTAAHCLYDYRGEVIGAPRIQTKAGDHFMTEVDNFEQTVNISAFVLHPEYFRNYSHVANDIAILFTVAPFRLNDFVQPIPLFSKDLDDEEDNGTIIGWGVLENGSIIGSAIPQKVELRLANDTYCTGKYGKNGFNPGLQTCSDDQTKGVCYGDFGGPLLVEENTVFHGIISYAPDVACLSGGIGNLFTRVTPYLDWIEAMTKNATEQDDDKDKDNAGAVKDHGSKIIVFTLFALITSLF